MIIIWPKNGLLIPILRLVLLELPVPILWLGPNRHFWTKWRKPWARTLFNFDWTCSNAPKNNPVGKDNEYDADRYAGVLELVREKSAWKENDETKHRGVAAYFCHNSYAAHVLDLKMENGKPVVEKVCCAIDCGVVVNPDAATNMAEGAITDGVGNAFFGELTFKDGVPQKNNFHQYQMIRMKEAPKEIDVHFVQNEIDPTGMGEPPFPPVFGAVANALYKATGQRHYNQPFIKEKQVVG